MRRSTTFIITGLTVLTFAAAAHGYVGPGAGFAVVTSFFAIFASLFLAVFAFLTLPIRRLLRAFRRRRALAKARVRRVVILGLDGLSPKIAAEMMAAGKLPHFARLAAEGTFKTLATTVPSTSPEGRLSRSGGGAAGASETGPSSTSVTGCVTSATLKLSAADPTFPILV